MEAKNKLEQQKELDEVKVKEFTVSMTFFPTCTLVMSMFMLITTKKN